MIEKLLNPIFFDSIFSDMIISISLILLSALTAP